MTSSSIPEERISNMKFSTSLNPEKILQMIHQPGRIRLKKKTPNPT
jgi:hypothetical protein